MPRRFCLPVSLAALALLTSCREARVEHYRVPKEKPAPTTVAPADAMAAATVPTGSEAITWTAPTT